VSERLKPVPAARGAAAAGRLGTTVLVIEHDLDLIKQADWIVDLGPEGGQVIATGTPEQVAEVEESHTGQFLSTVPTQPAAAAA